MIDGIHDDSVAMNSACSTALDARRQLANYAASAGAPTMRSSLQWFCQEGRAIAAAIVFVFLSGCSFQVPAPVADSLASKKAESLAGWETVVVDEKSLLKTLPQRTPLIFRNFTSVSAEAISPTSVSMAIKGVGRGSIGVAAVVASDGYFLTAGHVIRDADSLTLILMAPQEDGDLQVRQSPARIVWAPNEREMEPDIAVIHADTGPLEPFGLATKPPQFDDRILSAAWQRKTASSNVLVPTFAGGRILSATKHNTLTTSPVFTVVHHDAPMVPGDSGGPIVDRDGNLIGVNSTLSFPFSFWQWLSLRLSLTPKQVDVRNFYAEAIMPDPHWLREVIKRDRQRRALLHSSTPVQDFALPTMYPTAP